MGRSAAQEGQGRPRWRQPPRTAWPRQPASLRSRQGPRHPWVWGSLRRPPQAAGQPERHTHSVDTFKAFLHHLYHNKSMYDLHVVAEVSGRCQACLDDALLHGLGVSALHYQRFINYQGFPASIEAEEPRIKSCLIACRPGQYCLDGALLCRLDVGALRAKRGGSVVDLRSRGLDNNCMQLPERSSGTD